MQIIDPLHNAPLLDPEIEKAMVQERFEAFDNEWKAEQRRLEDKIHALSTKELAR